jgi:hypothetical protein
MGKKVPFKRKLKDYTTQDFWQALARDLSAEVKEGIEKYRELVLNPFSHYNTEKHEMKRELKEAIEAVRALKEELKQLQESKKKK